MAKYISLLRGINVGGNRKILMADLKRLYEKQGFSNCTTYIQSGNVIFDSEEAVSLAALETQIHRAILDAYGFEVTVVVRTPEAWNKVVANNPYLKPEIAIERLYVTFLQEEATPDKVALLQQMDFPGDQFEVIGSEIYICYATKVSNSKLTNNLIESKLKVKATSRNWKSTLKLQSLAQ